MSQRATNRQSGPRTLLVPRWIVAGGVLLTAAGCGEADSPASKAAGELASAPALTSPSPTGASRAAISTCATIQRGVRGTVHDTMIAGTNVGPQTLSGKAQGANPTMIAGDVTDSDRIPLLSFDLTTAGIPAGASITSATVHLTEEYIQGVAGGGIASVGALGAAWIEATTTWANYVPPLPSGANPNALYLPTTGGIVATFPVAASTPAGQVVDTPVSFDVTSLARSWFAAPATNYGIYALVRGYAWVNLATSEDPTASRRPSLTVCYAPPIAHHSVAAGPGYSVTIAADGTAWSEGDNSWQELGGGVAAAGDPARNAPLHIVGPTGLVSLALATENAVALTSAGAVWSWGTTVGSEADNFTPANNLNGAISIANAPQYAMAAKSDGSVWGWGYGLDAGGFGSFTPVQLPGFSNVVAVAAGGGQTLALKSDGTVWTGGFFEEPVVPVAGLSGIVALTGYDTQFALKSDGTVWTWSSGAATRVSGLSGIVAISCGDPHCLALASDGTVLAWGDNTYGELGNGTTVSSSTPVPVSGLSGVVDIAAGGSHSLARTSDGSVWMWGASTDSVWGAPPYEGGAPVRPSSSVPVLSDLP